MLRVRARDLIISTSSSRPLACSVRHRPDQDPRVVVEEAYVLCCVYIPPLPPNSTASFQIYGAIGICGRVIGHSKESKGIAWVLRPLLIMYAEYPYSTSLPRPLLPSILLRLYFSKYSTHDKCHTIGILPTRLSRHPHGGR